MNNGRSNNSHKISTQEILNDSPTVSQQTGYVFLEGGTGVTRRGGVPGVCLVCHASLMNSFFNLWIVATLTLVSFDVTLML